jgi:hypothetical protein
MLNKVEDMVIDKLVQQLNSHGINIDEATIKKAIENSPQIVAQIEVILATPGTADKIAKIKTLLLQSASGSGTTEGQTKGK